MEGKTDDTAEKTDSAVDVGIKRRNSIELQKLEAPSFSEKAASQEHYEKQGTGRIRPNSYPRPEYVHKPERLNFGMACLKYGLFAFNFIVWILGIAILGVSIWMKLDPDFWKLQLNFDVSQFKTATYLGIAIGAFILFVGFVGCCGALKENLIMLGCYFVIVLILVFMEAAAMGIVWHATNDKEFREKIKEQIRRGISQKDEVPGAQQFIDLLQSKLKCCGIVDIAEDYKYGIPRSCTNPDTGRPYEEACLDASLRFLKEKAALIGGISITIIILQLAVGFFAVCLFCALRQGGRQATFA